MSTPHRKGETPKVCYVTFMQDIDAEVLTLLERKAACVLRELGARKQYIDRVIDDLIKFGRPRFDHHPSQEGTYQCKTPQPLQNVSKSSSLNISASKQTS